MAAAPARAGAPVLLLVLLLLAARPRGAAAQDTPPWYQPYDQSAGRKASVAFGTTWYGGPDGTSKVLTADDISYCLNSWVVWLNKPAAYLCPSNGALDAFAQASGYDSYPDLALLWLGATAKKRLASVPAGVLSPADAGSGADGGPEAAAATGAGSGGGGGGGGTLDGGRRRRLRQAARPGSPPFFVQRFFNYLTIPFGPGCATSKHECGRSAAGLAAAAPGALPTRLPTYSCIDAGPDTGACDAQETLGFYTIFEGQDTPGWAVKPVNGLDNGADFNSRPVTLLACSGGASPNISFPTAAPGRGCVNIAPNLAVLTVPAPSDWPLANRAVVHGMRAISLFGPLYLLPWDYLLPPRTYHTLSEAFDVVLRQRKPPLQPLMAQTTTRKMLGTFMKEVLARPTMTGTLFAPTDAAWIKALDPSSIPNFAAFAGFPNLKAVVTNKNLMKPLLQYHFALADFDVEPTDCEYGVCPQDWRWLRLRMTQAGDGPAGVTSALQVVNPQSLAGGPGPIKVNQPIVIRKKPGSNPPVYCAIGLRQLGPPPSPVTDGFWSQIAFCSPIVPSYQNEFWGGGVVIQQVEGLPLLPWLFGQRRSDGNRTWLGDPPF